MMSIPEYVWKPPLSYKRLYHCPLTSYLLSDLPSCPLIVWSSPGMESPLQASSVPVLSRSYRWHRLCAGTTTVLNALVGFIQKLLSASPGETTAAMRSLLLLWLEPSPQRKPDRDEHPMASGPLLSIALRLHFSPRRLHSPRIIAASHLCLLPHAEVQCRLQFAEISCWWWR